MTKRLYELLLGLLVIVVITVMPTVSKADEADEADEFLVCYKRNNGDFLNLNVKLHSKLTNNEGGAPQTAYSVHGKYIAVNPSEKTRLVMATLSGTVVVEEKGKGTHMGLSVDVARQLVDISNGNVIPLFPLTLDCTDEEPSPTPNTWTCNRFGGLGTSEKPPIKQNPPGLAFATLKKVDETKNKECGFFQDGR
jgi:hypothetical protein